MIGIGERQLENLFCQIHSNGRSMHGGLLSFGQLNAAHPVWHFDADIPAGGVHSIIREDDTGGDKKPVGINFTSRSPRSSIDVNARPQA